jgi:hypothetical protein
MWTELILAKQTGYFAPGCKFNVESTDVILPCANVIADFKKFTGKT